ncbi:MAG TPA: hypothetical protein PKN93_15640 [Leptospiraceae bacterium]|nr:hypothetical protein [Leptospiraceae bacterium]
MKQNLLWSALTICVALGCGSKASNAARDLDALNVDSNISDEKAIEQICERVLTEDGYQAAAIKVTKTTKGFDLIFTVQHTEPRPPFDRASVWRAEQRLRTTFQFWRLARFSTKRNLQNLFAFVEHPIRGPGAEPENVFLFKTAVDVMLKQPGAATSNPFALAYSSGLSAKTPDMLEGEAAQVLEIARSLVPFTDVMLDQTTALDMPD